MFTGTLNFTPAEVACKCGCGTLPDEGFMEKVQALRDAVGFALPVTSGARCPAHNVRVSSSGLGGPHTTGRAADIALDPVRTYLVLSAALRMGFSGIGVAKWGLHLDDLREADGFTRPCVWTY